MSFYRRHLPHWQPEGRALFITFRLHRTCDQEHFLAVLEVAGMVIESLHYGADQLKRYDLHAYVVMSNHVHILLDAAAAPVEILKSLKGITARRANQYLGRAGQPFWQGESFDHWIRNEQEFRETARYIEENPVRAGLVALAEQYRWSSAWERAHRVGRTSTSDLSGLETIPDLSGLETRPT